jgi:hypothetical protein
VLRAEDSSHDPHVRRAAGQVGHHLDRSADRTNLRRSVAHRGSCVASGCAELGCEYAADRSRQVTQLYGEPAPYGKDSVK